MANRIGMLRAQAGLSYDGLAVVVSRDPNTVRRWESEKVPIPLDRATHLADFFDVSLDFLLCRERPTSGPGWPE